MNSEKRSSNFVADLHPGDRVEVFWRIVHEGEGEPSRTEERWWGASVTKIDHETLRCNLLYDEYGEFPPVQVPVTFIGPSSLRDEETGGEVMRWRREGSGDDDEVEDTEDDGATSVDDGVRDVYSMDDVVRAQDEVDREEGENIGDVMLAALQSLPTVQQTEMALKYREFADELKAQLASLMSRQGPGYVVTAEDIRTLFARIRERKASVATAT